MDWLPLASLFLLTRVAPVSSGATHSRRWRRGRKGNHPGSRGGLAISGGARGGAAGAGRLRVDRGRSANRPDGPGGTGRSARGQPRRGPLSGHASGLRQFQTQVDRLQPGDPDLAVLEVRRAFLHQPHDGAVRSCFTVRRLVTERDFLGWPVGRRFHADRLIGATAEADDRQGCSDHPVMDRLLGWARYGSFARCTASAARVDPPEIARRAGHQRVVHV
jgi:hypothetical protein